MHDAICERLESADQHEFGARPRAMRVFVRAVCVPAACVSLVCLHVVRALLSAEGLNVCRMHVRASEERAATKTCVLALQRNCEQPKRRQGAANR